LVEIDVTCDLEGFRRFLINSTCRNFMPESYLRDPEVFPEKEGEQGSIYIEAVDKVDLKKIRDITFINAKDILGIIYTSKSGNSRLKWRQLRGSIGRVTGEASSNSLVNLSMAMDLIEQSLPALGSESEEGQKVLAAIRSLTGVIGPRKGKTNELQQTEIMNMLQSLPQAGGATPEGKAMAAAPPIPNMPTPPGAGASVPPPSGPM
jgi:hypothetical protein